MAEVLLTPDLPAGPFGAVILSSETGVRAAARLRDAGQPLPGRAFCVGDRTAEVARASGFDAISAGGAVENLAALILSRPDEGPLLWLRGQDRAGDLLSLLPGRQVAEAVVYAQKECLPTAEAMAVIAAPGPVVVPLFSPRTARLFVQALPETRSATLLPVAMSGNVAAALPPDLARLAVVAERPDAPAMIAAISRAISLGVP
ncbi:uroporphyrinogen-III synthase [Rhodobacter sp. Har01]|uniref:uroporphyrinogen-III synthase n=1 Tax=Rhodobacter sp. Har01 TaxID=2883999 RepID=UPI0039B52B1E